MPQPTPLTTQPTDSPNTPFLLAALACVLPAALGVFWFFSPDGSQSDPAVRVVVLAAAGAAYLMAARLYTWPSRTRALTRPLVDLPAALIEVKSQVTDVNVIKKEYFRYQSQLEGVVDQFTQAVNGLNGELARRLQDLDARQQAFDQMAADRRETERRVSEMRQEVSRAAARTKAWEQAVVEFAQLLERTSDPASDLSPEYRKVAAKMTGYFAKAFGPFGLQLVSPEEGDRYDPRVHQVGGTEPHPTVPPGHVVRCVEWGFVLKDDVQKAKVVLAAQPPTPPPPVPTELPSAAPPANGFGPVPISDTPPRATATARPRNA